jgi:hypothetical protein
MDFGIVIVERPFVLLQGLLKDVSEGSIKGAEDNIHLSIILHAQLLDSLSNSFPYCLFDHLMRTWILGLMQQNTQLHVMEVGMHELRLQLGGCI